MAKHVVVFESNGREYIKVCRSYRDKDGNSCSELLESHGSLEKALKRDPEYLNKLRERVARENEAEKLAKQKLYEVEAQKRIEEYNAMGQQERQKHYRTLNVGVAPIRQLWKKLKLPEYFLGAQKRRRFKFDYDKAAFLLTERRMLDPSSKTGDFKSIGEGIFDYAGVDHMDDLYDVLDLLAEDKTAIVRHLNKVSAKLIERKYVVAFYDVTTYSFESQNADTLRAFGMSKDHKNNEVQVVLGLVIDEKGIPVDYDLYPGNTSEFGTLIPVIKRLMKTYNITKIIVVADRGLNSGKNLLALQKLGCDFVIAQKVRDCTADEKKKILDQSNWEKTVVDDDGVVVAQYKKMDKKRTIRETKTGKNGRRYEVGEPIGTVDTTWVVSYSPERASRDKAERDKAVARAQKAIANGTANQSGRGWRYYIAFVDDLTESTVDKDKNTESPCEDKVEKKVEAANANIKKEEVTDKDGLDTQAKKVANIKEGKVEIRESNVNDNNLAGGNKDGTNAEAKKVAGANIKEDKTVEIEDSENKDGGDKDKIDKAAKDEDNPKEDKNQPADKPPEIKKKAILDLEKIAEQAKWDGFYAICTSLKDEPPEKIAQIYGGLWQIERCFRISKHQLRARPVWVWNPEHVKGHFVSCYITLFIERLMEHFLKVAIPGHNVSPDKITEALSNKLVVVTKMTDGKIAYLRLFEEGLCDAYFKALGLMPLGLNEPLDDMRKKLRLKEIIRDTNPRKRTEPLEFNIDDIKPAIPELAYPGDDIADLS